MLSECQGSFCGQRLLSAKLVLGEIGITPAEELLTHKHRRQKSCDTPIDIVVQKREQLTVVDAIHIH